MLSRTLGLAAVLLLAGWVGLCFRPAQAQNLEAGKSPSQIFAQTCSACHKSPRGLLRTVPPGSLGGFLRQHYTTSPDMAGILASYLVSNGASDTRYGGGQPKGAKGAAPAAAQGEPGQLERAGRPQHMRHGEEMQRPAEAPGSRPTVEGQGGPGEQAGEGHRSKRLSKRGKAKEEPRVEPARPEQPEPAAEDKSKAEPAVGETAKGQSGKEEIKPEGAKPAAGSSSEPGKAEEKPASSSSEAKPEDRKPDREVSEPAKETERPAVRSEPAPSSVPAERAQEPHASVNGAAETARVTAPEVSPAATAAPVNTTSTGPATTSPPVPPISK